MKKIMVLIMFVILSSLVFATPTIIDSNVDTTKYTALITVNFNETVNTTLVLSSTSDYSSIINIYNDSLVDGISLYLTSLNIETTYYYKFNATNANGVNVSSNLSFTTEPRTYNSFQRLILFLIPIVVALGVFLIMVRKSFNAEGKVNIKETVDYLFIAGMVWAITSFVVNVIGGV